MRILLDILAVSTLVGLVVVFTWMDRRDDQHETEVVEVVEALRVLQQQVHYHAAAESARLNIYGWPEKVDPIWFGNNPPRNDLIASARRPWLEIAGVDEAALSEPLTKMAIDESVADFWYNPYNGVVRARVPVMVSDQEAILLYNRINNSGVNSIFPTRDELAQAELTVDRMIEDEQREQPSLKIFVHSPDRVPEPDTKVAHVPE